MSLGNFGTAAGAGLRTATGPTGSRVFRGLMDDINVLNRPLTLDQSRLLQKAQPFDLVRPALTILLTPPNVVISWDATTVWQLEYTEIFGSGIWNNVTELPAVVGDLHTVTAPAPAMPRFYRLRR